MLEEIAPDHAIDLFEELEDDVQAVVALTFFIPLLIGTGGNTGSQTSRP